MLVEPEVNISRQWHACKTAMKGGVFRLGSLPKVRAAVDFCQSIIA